MVDVNICWNVNGLNAPLKRTRILDFLCSKKVSIALIQESHLKTGDVQRFQNGSFKLMAYSCTQTKTKGVLILVDRRLSLTIDQVGDDGLGRFVYCKDSITLKWLWHLFMPLMQMRLSCQT